MPDSLPFLGEFVSRIFQRWSARDGEHEYRVGPDAESDSEDIESNELQRRSTELEDIPDLR